MPLGCRAKRGGEERERERDRETEGERKMKRKRKTDRQTKRERERERGRETKTQESERERERERERKSHSIRHLRLGGGKPREYLLCAWHASCLFSVVALGWASSPHADTTSH